MHRRRWMWLRLWHEQGAVLPIGWAFVIDADGARIVDTDGAYLIVEVA